MRFVIIIMGLFVIQGSCSKNEDDSKIAEDLNTSPWLEAKMKEYQNCVCLTAIFTGVYQGQRVYEIRGVDPLCNGINVVYKSDGSAWFHSSNRETYDNYLSTANDLEEIWRCSRDDNYRVNLESSIVK